MRRQQGFTLFEVLVALAIMAVALAALLRASGVAVDNSENMKQRMQAGWAAQSRLALLQARQEWPATGSSSGDTADDGSPLSWQQQVKVTPNAAIREVQIKVLAPGSNYVLAEINGYLRQPQGSKP